MKDDQHPVSPVDRGLGVVAGLVAAYYVVLIVQWWLGNFIGMVSFSVAMPLAAGIGSYMRLKRPPLVASKSTDSRSSSPLFFRILAVLSIGLNAWCYLSGELFVGAVGLWFASTAVVGLVFSQKIGKRVFLPMLALVFTAPLGMGYPARIEMTLQLISASLAEVWLHIFQVPVTREGILLMTPKFWNTVNDTCSGVGTISTLVIYSIMFGIILRLSERSVWIAALVTIPLGLFVNGGRIAWISMLGEEGGSDLAMGPMHDISGTISFLTGYAFILGCLLLFRRRAIRQLRVAS
ncbi:MAG: exosortase/archaeosortase family protein [Myxococcales bacterium]|nr:exosortase/archaeosortase family protein [Myxococcales bacterium]